MDGWPQATVRIAGQPRWVEYGMNGSMLLAINDRGDIAGTASGLESSTAFAVVGGKKRELDSFARPASINNAGEIVGTIGDDPAVVSRAITRAVMWTKAGRRDLTCRIPIDSGWLLKEATGINNRGEIVGWGLLHGEKRAFLLLPLREAVSSTKRE
jgi:hypothetical protein